MKKHCYTLMLFMLSNNTFVQLDANQFYNLFCCATTAIAIQPVTNDPTHSRPIQGFDIIRFINGQKSIYNARAQALRLIAIIENEELLDQKNYIALEKIAYHKARRLDREYFFADNKEQLAKKYSKYSSSNEDLPESIENERLRQLKNRDHIDRKLTANRKLLANQLIK